MSKFNSVVTVFARLVEISSILRDIYLKHSDEVNYLNDNGCELCNDISEVFGGDRIYKLDSNGVKQVRRRKRRVR